jgi:hypothetical protein
MNTIGLGWQDIIEMARQAGFVVDEADFIKAPKTLRVGFQLELDHFADLVAAAARAHEREACAKLCEDAPEPDGADLAERIRARGTT